MVSRALRYLGCAFFLLASLALIWATFTVPAVTAGIAQVLD